MGNVRLSGDFIPAMPRIFHTAPLEPLRTPSSGWSVSTKRQPFDQT
jgi:hypothetical protein